MSVKVISSIEGVSKALKKKGIAVSDEALSVIIDTAFSELMDNDVKLNDTIMGLRNDMSELMKTEASMDKLLAEKKLADEEKEMLKGKLKEVESKKNRDSSSSKKSKSPPKRSIIFSD